jgi:hypothetical protein
MPRPIQGRRSTVLLAEDEPHWRREIRRCFAAGEFRRSTPERVHVRKLSLWFGQRSMNEPVAERAVYKGKRSLTRRGDAERSRSATTSTPINAPLDKGESPSFLRDCTERGSRVKPLRSAPTARAARQQNAGLTRLTLRSCAGSTRKNGQRIWTCPRETSKSCLRFLSEHSWPSGREFSHKSSAASRRETLTGFLHAAMLPAQNEAYNPSHKRV